MFQVGVLTEPKSTDEAFVDFDEAIAVAEAMNNRDENLPVAVWRLPMCELEALFLCGRRFREEP